jgi:voltage-gated potassium channel
LHAACHHGRTEHLELNIEEAQITAASPLVGTTVKGSRIRDQLGVIVVAIKKSSGHMVFNPPAESVLEAGDIVIMLGRRSDLDQASRLALAARATT